jgi:hypothetical protein
MTRTEFIKLIRERKPIPRGVELPSLTIHVRAAEGYLPRIAGLDAKPPTLSQAHLAALLNGPDRSNGERANSGDPAH